MTPLRLLLLGGSGFVGSAVLEHLGAPTDSPVQVRALLRRPGAVQARPWLETIAGELERPPADLAFSEPYVLVHFAVHQIDRDPKRFREINVNATRELLAGLRTPPLGIIYGSSMSVYGQSAQDGVTETAPAAPETPLAVSRWEAEQVIGEYARAHQAASAALRPRFVLGRGDRFVLPGIAKLARRRWWIGAGDQKYSVVAVNDYAAIVVALARHMASGTLSGQHAFNVGYRKPISFAELYGQLGSARPRVKIPVNARLLRLLRHAPVRAVQSTATQLELIGLSHWADVSALARVLAEPAVSSDPVELVRALAPPDLARSSAV